MGRALPPLQDISQHRKRWQGLLSTTETDTHEEHWLISRFRRPAGWEKKTKKKREREREPQVPFFFFILAPFFLTSVSEAGLILPPFPPLLQHLTDELLFGTCAGGKDALQGRWSGKGQREVTSEQERFCLLMEAPDKCWQFSSEVIFNLPLLARWVFHLWLPGALQTGEIRLEKNKNPVCCREKRVSLTRRVVRRLARVLLHVHGEILGIKFMTLAFLDTGFDGRSLRPVSVILGNHMISN